MPDLLLGLWLVTQTVLGPSAGTLSLDGPSLCLHDLSWQDAQGTWQRWQLRPCL